MNVSDVEQHVLGEMAYLTKEEYADLQSFFYDGMRLSAVVNPSDIGHNRSFEMN